MEGDSFTDDWTLITPGLKSDETTDDIEVISNPSTVESDMISDHAPKLLYSDMLKREKIKSALSESDIEVVPEEPLSPQLEFDDEEYINEILRSTQPSALNSESDESESECEGESYKQLFDDKSNHVVLEVNLTLLSFSIIVGISGMSGFFLGGIYSAILTSNYNHSTEIMDVSNPAPQLQPGYYRKMNMCPNNACDKQIYHIEENMRQMKQTLSHDVKACHKKLSKTMRENAAMHQTMKATSKQFGSEKKCARAQERIAKLQSKTRALKAELASQNAALNDLKVHNNAVDAEGTLQIISLKAMLEESRGDLRDARDAVRVLGEANFECKKDYMLSGMVQNNAVVVASKKTNEAVFWKNLYQHAILDLEEAEVKLEELTRSLNEEFKKAENAQKSRSDVKVDYIKARAETNYYKDQIEDVEARLSTMGVKYNRAKAQKDSLTEEYESLKALNKEIENNLYTCTNLSTQFEQKASNAYKLKDYIENVLIHRISKDKEQYQNLKTLYREQEQTLAEHSEHQTFLEDILIRKISGKRKKFLQVKSDLEELLSTFSKKKGESQKMENILVSKVAKNKNERLDAKDELEKSKQIISEFEDQMREFETYTVQIEGMLHEMNNDIIMRNTVQKKFMEKKEADWDGKYNEVKNYYQNLLNSQMSLSEDLSTKFAQLNERLEQTGETLSRRTRAYSDLKKRHTLTQGILKEESDRAEFWKSNYAESQLNNQKSEMELNSCMNGKMTAIAEYKKTTNMLLELIHNVASKPKITQMMKISEGQNFSILQNLYNASTEASEVNTCLAVVSPLFPGIQTATLLSVMNMTQSSDKSSYKMSTALAKYWGGVDKTWNKLNKKSQKQKRHPKCDDDEDDDDPEHDWYMSRHPTRGQYPQGPKADWYMKRKGDSKEAKYRYSKYEENNWYLQRKPFSYNKKHGRD